MEYSSKLRSTAKKIGLSVEEIAMADLMASGWSVTDAYLIAYHKGFSKSTEEVERVAGVIAASPQFTKRTEDVSARVRKENLDASRSMLSDDSTFIEQSSKEYTLRKLVEARESHTAGSPDWLKINQQIIEVTQMKKDEIKEEDSTIHFHLPLKCYQCSLYMKEEEKKNRKK